MIIRVPGSTNEESNQSLGREVAQRIAEAWPGDTRGKQVPELNIRLTAPAGMSTTAMADAIADQIVRQLRELNF